MAFTPADFILEFICNDQCDDALHFIIVRDWTTESPGIAYCERLDDTTRRENAANDHKFTSQVFDSYSQLSVKFFSSGG